MLLQDRLKCDLIKGFIIDNFLFHICKYIFRRFESKIHALRFTLYIITFIFFFIDFTLKILKIDSENTKNDFIR